MHNEILTELRHGYLIDFLGPYLSVYLKELLSGINSSWKMSLACLEVTGKQMEEVGLKEVKMAGKGAGLGTGTATQL